MVDTILRPSIGRILHRNTITKHNL